MYVHQIIKVYSTGTAYVEHTFSSKKKAEDMLKHIRAVDEQYGWTWTDKDSWGEPVRRWNSADCVFGWKVESPSKNVKDTIFYFIEKHEVV